MGIDLDRWSGRVIGQSKGVVRLLPVTERAKKLFGDSGAEGAVDSTETGPSGMQRSLSPELEVVPKPLGRRRGGRAVLDGNAEFRAPDATALDCGHAPRAGGHAAALRALIKAEQELGPDFLRLANALSALYPCGGTEKRLLDAMLLAVPR